MFEPGIYDQLRDAVAAVADARAKTALATGAQLCDAARLVEQAQTILDGIQIDLLSRIEDTKAYEDEGASTVVTWMCRELRIPTSSARRRVKAGHTLRRLPQTAQAMSSGHIRLGHVYELTAGITKLGEQTMLDAQTELLPLATTADPGEVRAAITHLGHILHPDELDDAWAKGMDKRDVKLARCGDGYHLSGFLDILTGAKVHAILKTASAGNGDDDQRSPSERRVDALGRMADTTTNGATTSNGGVGGGRNGIRPQLHVIADLGTLLGTPGAEPARLAGFGPIGRDLLGYLTCTGEITTVLTDGVTGGPTPQAAVLNVGRTTRLANPRQRVAVIARQNGHCATPGCGNTTLEVHHVAWWHRDNGTTDLHNLVGICPACHHLTHRQKLRIEPDGHGGFTFHRSTGKTIDDHTRRTRIRTRRIIRRALHETTGQRAPKKQPEPPPPPPPPPAPIRPDWTTHDYPQRPRSHGEHHLERLLRQHHRPTRR